MKYLTFTVPSFNSEDYLNRCIDSLLVGGEKVEIIIVDDGSTDMTGQIADNYQEQYPTIVKAIHQPNKGHGGAVNAGLAAASGKYFKVVDSDDWVAEDSLKLVLKKIDYWHEHDQQVDMIVNNYIYENFYQHKSFTVHYRNVFKNGQICKWQNIGHFNVSQYLIMHALIFDTAILKKSHVDLPLHTFYVDTLFATQPLPFVNTICYLDTDFYHYFIGREDQSVTESVMIKRIDQQIKVTKMVAKCTDIDRPVPAKLTAYVRRNVSVMLAVSSVHLLLIGTDEALEKREELWDTIKENDRKLYRKLRFGSVSGLTYLPTKLGRVLTVIGYKMSRKVVKFQ